jgi:hypothetical protein
LKTRWIYVKKWGKRVDDFTKKMQVEGDILRAENESAAERYARLMQQYSDPNAEIDLNEIAKNMGITLMQLELLLRELSIQMAERNAYDIAKDKLGEKAGNPPRLSGTYDSEPWGSITEGVGKFTD